MVRTKTRPRTLEERYPNDPPDIKLSPKYRIVYNNRIFNDHTGAPALMSWESPGVQRSLPPLASWIFYMTHPDVPRDFDGSLFYSSLQMDHQLGRGGSFRYEFFLPGATAEECRTHVRGEMESRSDEEKAREMYHVQFDPIPTPDWDEEMECNPSPMERPIVSRRMKAKSEEGFEDGIFGWMETRKMSLWEQAADEATDNALELGWESW
ncbi:hypothetical protein LCI18_005985 [Fusarium solani-melongenae]|uniref:Uncharacterized protein n=1 Tax=Fusarium solani subsp. cucurbitae TaxID=2747967 RepID=A0ACD3Z1R2_FUSSC|nr:hypothetical protein LCI18_005985 [Fusarium solani-melongenae]